MTIPAKGQLSGKLVPCEICGKEMYYTQSRLKKNKHFYCSRECSAIGVHKNGSENRTCEFCGNIFVVRKSTSQRFCSTLCQNKWQQSNIGERNPKYSRRVHQCDYCGKPHTVRKYRLLQKNLFCSKQCRQDWYANVWSQNDNWRNESRRRAIEILSNGLISRTNSKPQKILDGLLDSAGVSYIREKPVGAYCVDNYLKDYNLCIEVMGDFWHTNPEKYEIPKYVKQEKTISRDKKKREYIKESTGCYPLYLWENDIIQAPKKCLALITEYINSGGHLPNYNSFNYEMTNSVLSLKDNILISFQEQYTANCD